MNTNVSTIVEAAWEFLDEGHPARRAIAGVQDDDVRQAVSQQNLRPDEFAAFAERNLTIDEVARIASSAPVVDNADDVRELAEATRIDRRARRIVFADEAVYANISTEEQHDIVMSMDPGLGRDDFLMSVLPAWISEGQRFDAKALAPTIGSFAGAYMLAAASPSDLSDSEVWELISNPPEKWAHPEEDRKWHDGMHIRAALGMVFTHRPVLVPKVLEEPELLSCAAQAPHWDPELAYGIEGFDLREGTLTGAATRNTPGMLLSLVWNPKTPLEQAQMIRQIAGEGVDNTPFADAWKVTAAAADRRIELQQWHVEDFNDVDDHKALARLERRIKNGMFGKVKSERHLNGMRHPNMMWWPKRFEEALALLTNPKAIGGDWSRIRGHVSDVAPRTAPKGTWTHQQLVDAGMSDTASSEAPDPTRGLTYRSQPAASGRGFIRYAVTSFEALPELDQAEAWGLLMTLAADSSGYSPEPDLVDATLAILA